LSRNKNKTENKKEINVTVKNEGIKNIFKTNCDIEIKKNLTFKWIEIINRQEKNKNYN